MALITKEHCSANLPSTACRATPLNMNPMERSDILARDAGTVTLPTKEIASSSFPSTIYQRHTWFTDLALHTMKGLF